MATIMTTGQITLVDLTDQRTSSFYLQADKSKIQVADINQNPTSYTPDYTTSPLTITPAFFFGNEKITLTNNQIKYTINGTEVTEKIISGATDPDTYNYFVRDGHLIIKQNISSFNGAKQIRIVATALQNTITDTETGVPLGNDIEATIEIALVESGKAGQSINKIETYYKTTEEYSTPSISDTDWDQDASKFILSATNKYLWAYHKTYYVDNLGTITSENGNIFLAGTYGDTGATGANGKSVDSITEQYYISTSDKSPTGGTWSDTAPTTLTTTQYLWTRTVIVYKESNGSTTEPTYLPGVNGAVDATWNLAVSEVKKTNDALAELQSSYNSLQNQIDGSIDTWYGAVDPKLNNPPANEWTDNATKIRHNGDLYYNTETGAAWRYVVTVDGSGNFESATWTIITDAALTEALKEIQDIGAAVDKKMTIYYSEITEQENSNNYGVPVSAHEGDLWIQGENGDQYKCTVAYTSGVNKNNWTEYWEIANKSIGQVDILFYKNDSSDVAPGDDVAWSTTSPEWEQGKYIWQRTRTYDRSGSILTQSTPVCITSASRSIVSVINYYLATNASSGVTTSTTGWETDVSNAILSKDAPYLWNYEKVEYTYGNPDISDPTIIGNYSKDGENGNPGRGIVSITEYYLINNSANTPTFEINNSNGTPTSNEWQNTIQISTDEKPYLWNAEVIKYTSSPIYKAKKPALIGYRGVGIESATVYYLRNKGDTPTKPSSDSDATAKGWSTSFEDVNKDNKFLWSCTVTAFTDGVTVKVSEPAIIARYTQDGADAVFGIVEAQGKTIFSDQDNTPIKLIARFMVGGEEITAQSYEWSAIGSTKEGDDNELEVARADVTNVATFICKMIHADYGEVVDRITLQDKTDPMWVEIVSSNGDKFTNGNTSTTLTATIYGSVKGKYTNEEMNSYYFNWKKYNKNGDLVDTFAPITSGVGVTGYQNTITIADGDVDSKAIFTVEVTKESPTVAI